MIGIYQIKDLNFNKDEYLKFLKSISYIVEEKEDFKIDTSNVDEGNFIYCRTSISCSC